jgi:hypothetical protein
VKSRAETSLNFERKIIKKRKAKRTKSTIHIDILINRAINDAEELKTQALTDLIVKIIVDITLEELYAKEG